MNSSSRKRPTQQRSKQLVNAILEASRQILREEGPEALTTNRIAEVSGANIASLYRWFPNKEAIIGELLEEQAEAEISELYDIHDKQIKGRDLSLLEMVDLVIDPLVDRQLRFLSIHACFYTDYQARFDVGKRRIQESEDTLMGEANQLLSQLLCKQNAELSKEDADLQAFMLTRAVQGICFSAASDRPEWLKSPNFRKEIRRMVLPYIGLSYEP